MSDSCGNLETNKSGTLDDEIESFVMGGSRDVVAALGDVRKTCGGPAAMGYAGGMAAGLRAWLVTNHGVKEARELFYRLASDADLDEQTAVLQ